MTDKTPPFHGSYLPQQVQFLLKPISVETVVDTAHKEALIQSGRRHYSEMLSPRCFRLPWRATAGVWPPTACSWPR